MLQMLRQVIKSNSNENLLRKQWGQKIFDLKCMQVEFFDAARDNFSIQLGSRIEIAQRYESPN